MAALCRLDVEGYDEPLFVWTNFEDDSLSVKVSDGACTWQGTLCMDQVQELAEMSKIPVDQFLDETMKALSCKSVGGPLFVCSVITTEGGIVLTWKKLSDGVKFQLGSINLVAAPNQSVNSLFLNHLLDYVSTLGVKIGDLEGKCRRLTDERQTALDSLQTYSTVQEVLENELYGKFKLILNEKKGKIRKLMDLKTHLTDQNEEMQRKIWDTKKTSVVPFLAAKAETSKNEAMDVEESTVHEAPKQGNVESLLCDAAYKPPSPPPTKKRCVSKGAKKGNKIALPQPPPLSTSSANKSRHTEGDMSLDSNELLDML